MGGLAMLRSSADVKNNSNFNMSIIIGLLLVTLIIIIIMGIVMNIWVKQRGQKNTPTGTWRKLSDEKSRPISLVSVKTLSPPMAAYTLPTFRKSDTWSTYLKMIQTPDKLNDVVHSMKISNSTSNDTSDNRKVSYENDSNCTLQQDLQQESKSNYNNNHDDNCTLLDERATTYRYSQYVP